MNRSIEQLKNKVSQLMEGDEMSLLFDMVKQDLVSQILLTQPNETVKREELYMISQGVVHLERKMNGIANESFKENE